MAYFRLIRDRASRFSTSIVAEQVNNLCYSSLKLCARQTFNLVDCSIPYVIDQFCQPLAQYAKGRNLQLMHFMLCFKDSTEQYFSGAELMKLAAALSEFLGSLQVMAFAYKYRHATELHLLVSPVHPDTGECCHPEKVYVALWHYLRFLSAKPELWGGKRCFPLDWEAAIERLTSLYGPEVLRLHSS